ncbi:MAG TPA: hypothetical protein VGP22_08220, partial [Albitalea sp.]|nr:hypothetical protein [Albitalea sp.]
YADIDQNAGRLQEALAALGPARARMPANGAPPAVLVVARTSVDTVKNSRPLGYLSAGFIGGTVRANFDFTFTLTNPHQQPGLAWIKLSEKGWKAAIALIESNSRLDVAEGQTQLVCSVDGWRLAFDKSTLTCAVGSGPGEALRRGLEFAKLVQPVSAHTADPWFDTMVELAVRVLQLIGFRRLELAADDSGGWHAFARLAAPELAARGARLQSLWSRYEGHELDWGTEAAEDAVQ